MDNEEVINGMLIEFNSLKLRLDTLAERNSKILLPNNIDYVLENSCCDKGYELPRNAKFVVAAPAQVCTNATKTTDIGRLSANFVVRINGMFASDYGDYIFIEKISDTHYKVRNRKAEYVRVHIEQLPIFEEDSGWKYNLNPTLQKITGHNLIYFCLLPGEEIIAITCEGAEGICYVDIPTDSGQGRQNLTKVTEISLNGTVIASGSDLLNLDASPNAVLNFGAIRVSRTNGTAIIAAYGLDANASVIFKCTLGADTNNRFGIGEWNTNPTATHIWDDNNTLEGISVCLPPIEDLPLPIEISCDGATDTVYLEGVGGIWNIELNGTLYINTEELSLFLFVRSDSSLSSELTIEWDAGITSIININSEEYNRVRLVPTDGTRWNIADGNPNPTVDIDVATGVISVCLSPFGQPPIDLGISCDGAINTATLGTLTSGGYYNLYVNGLAIVSSNRLVNSHDGSRSIKEVLEQDYNVIFKPLTADLNPTTNPLFNDLENGSFTNMTEDNVRIKVVISDASAISQNHTPVNPTVSFDVTGGQGVEFCLAPAADIPECTGVLPEHFTQIVVPVSSDGNRDTFSKVTEILMDGVSIAQGTDLLNMDSESRKQYGELEFEFQMGSRYVNIRNSVNDIRNSAVTLTIQTGSDDNKRIENSEFNTNPTVVFSDTYDQLMMCLPPKESLYFPYGHIATSIPWGEAVHVVLTIQDKDSRTYTEEGELLYDIADNLVADWGIYTCYRATYDTEGRRYTDIVFANSTVGDELKIKFKITSPGANAKTGYDPTFLNETLVINGDDVSFNIGQLYCDIGFRQEHPMQVSGQDFPLQFGKSYNIHTNDRMGKSSITLPKMAGNIIGDPTDSCSTAIEPVVCIHESLEYDLVSQWNPELDPIGIIGMRSRQSIYLMPIGGDVEYPEVSANFVIKPSISMSIEDMWHVGYVIPMCTEEE